MGNNHILDAQTSSCYNNMASSLIAYLNGKNVSDSWCTAMLKACGVPHKKKDPLCACILLIHLLSALDSMFYGAPNGVLEFFDFSFDINEKNTDFNIDDKMLAKINRLPREEVENIKEKIVRFYQEVDYSPFICGKFPPIIGLQDSLCDIYITLLKRVSQSVKFVLNHMNNLCHDEFVLLGQHFVSWYEKKYYTEDILNYKNWKNKNLTKKKTSVALVMKAYVDDVINTQIMYDSKSSVSFSLLENHKVLKIESCMYEYDQDDNLYLLKSLHVRKDNIAWNMEEAFEMAMIKEYFVDANGQVVTYQLGRFVMENISHYSKENIMKILRIIYMYKWVVADLKAKAFCIAKNTLSMDEDYMEVMDKLSSSSASIVWRRAKEQKLIKQSGKLYKWLGNGQDFASLVYEAQQHFWSSSQKFHNRAPWEPFCDFFNVDFDKGYLKKQKSKLYGGKGNIHKVTPKMKNIKLLYRDIRP